MSKYVQCRTANQETYKKAILNNDIVICKGPAGSGKTHIAIGVAMSLLDKGSVSKILIARPAITAGEEIGFLPGDSNSKLDPYVRPILDELLYFSSPAEIKTLQHSNVLEIVPIGYMRGRTFKDAFVIIDECQNATMGQIKMIVTRLGESSKMVLTGDTTQSDLHWDYQGGLQYAYDLCYALFSDSIGCITLDNADIVRHSLVQKFVVSWDKHLDFYNKNGRINKELV